MADSQLKETIEHAVDRVLTNQFKTYHSKKTVYGIETATWEDIYNSTLLQLVYRAGRDNYPEPFAFSLMARPCVWRSMLASEWLSITLFEWLSMSPWNKE